jgi:hypothetical protein
MKNQTPSSESLFMWYNQVAYKRQDASRVISTETPLRQSLSWSESPMCNDTPLLGFCYLAESPTPSQSTIYRASCAPVKAVQRG